MVRAGRERIGARSRFFLRRQSGLALTRASHGCLKMARSVPFRDSGNLTLTPLAIRVPRHYLELLRSTMLYQTFRYVVASMLQRELQRSPTLVILRIYNRTML
jgi:hypothetical protein